MRIEDYIFIDEYSEYEAISDLGAEFEILTETAPIYGGIEEVANSYDD